MKSIGVKRQRSNEDQSDNKETKKLRADDPYLSVFALPELVENILKYLINYPKAILNISGVSKMHNKLIQNKATWVRLGFSKNLCQGSTLSNHLLKIVLARIRTAYQYKKLARVYSDVSCIEGCYLRTKEESDAVLGHKLGRDKQFQLLSNNYLSDNAAASLLSTLHSASRRFVSLTDLIGWLEEDPRILPTPASGTRLVPKKGSFIPITAQFDQQDCSVHATQILIKAIDNSDDYDKDVVIRRVLPDPTKTLLFVSNANEEMEISSFIKTEPLQYDRVNKIIEYCGNLCDFVAAKFRHDWDKALNFLCETNEPGQWAKAYLHQYSIECDCFERWVDEDHREYGVWLEPVRVVENVPLLERNPIIQYYNNMMYNI